MSKKEIGGESGKYMSFSKNILLMLWKNQIIKRRRKLELLLMLTQIFIWFGWGASRYAFADIKFFPPVAPSESRGKINFYQHSSFISNHPIVIYIDGQTQDDFNNRKVSINSLDKLYEKNSNVDVEFLKSVLEHLKVDWYRAVGDQEFVFAKNYIEFIEALKLDDRMAFGINIKKLKPDQENIEINLHFLETEIPIDKKVKGQRYVCRDIKKAYDMSSLSYLQTGRNTAMCTASKYLVSGFVYMQAFLTNAILRAKNEYFTNKKIQVLSEFGNKYMNEPYRQTMINRLELPGVAVIAEDFPMRMGIDSDYAYLAKGTPIFIMFAFSRFIVTSLQDIIAEKESKLRDIMNIFGMTTSEYWFSWLFTVAAMNILYTGLAVIISRLTYMFGDASYLIVAVIFYCYLLSLLTSGFMLAGIFDSMEISNAVGMVINLLLNISAMIIRSFTNFSIYIRLVLCIFSPISFSLILDDIVKTLPMRPLTVSMLFTAEGSHLSMYIAILIITPFLYWILAWYIDSIRKTGYGTAQPWYWPAEVLLKYFMGVAIKEEFDQYEPIASSLDNNEDIDASSGNMEPPSVTIKSKGKAISIRSLVKEFTVEGKQKRAVNGLDLDIYYSEIFALLGHNGAGKTTTINVLAGLTPATSGNAVVAGYRIDKHPILIRKSISMCPQHNIFIHELLVIEHLVFFAGLRGIDVRMPLLKLQNVSNFAQDFMQDYQKKLHLRQIEQINGQAYGKKFAASNTNTWEGILAMIDRFGLTQKLFSFPFSLSGGQKRRLWLALALIAEPKIVILDEPTSGVDPVGRQQIWKVIQEERRSGRCIILTTHHMEEADMLADRKAVMVAGKLKCVGTSLYLKKKFGIGYYLEIELAKTLKSEQIEICKSNIHKLIMNYMPNAKTITSSDQVGTWASNAVIKGLITYAFPLDDVDRFGETLTALESAKQELGIAEYAMSMSTLEEIFFKLGEQLEDDINQATISDLAKLTIHGGNSNNRTVGIEKNLAELEKESEEAINAAKNYEDDVIFGIDEENDNMAGNLVNQIMPDGSTYDILNKFSGIVYLRFAQIFHNLFYFTIDILLPTILFLVGLAITRGSAGGIGYMYVPKDDTFSMSDYKIHMNNTIPYMADTMISSEGTKTLHDLLTNLPFSDLLLPLHECMSADYLATHNISSCIDELSKAVDISIENPYNIQFDPIPKTRLEFLLTKPKPVKQFKPGHFIIEEDYPYVFDMLPILEKADPRGNVLRNFIMRSSTADIYNKWGNFYPLALYFEPSQYSFKPNTSFIDNTAEIDRIQIRYLWNPYAIHAFPSFLNGLSNTLMKLNFKEPYNSQKIEIKNTPVYRTIPIHVTDLTWALYSLLSLGISFLPHKYGNQVMHEAYTKTKHSLIVMGCPLWIYWIGTFLINWLVMIFTSSIVCIAVAYFIPIYVRYASCIPVLLFSLAFYSASMLMYAYFWTFVFDTGKSYALFIQLSTMFLSLAPAYVITIFFDYKLQIGNIPLKYLTTIFHRTACFLLAPYNPMGALLSVAMVIAQAESQDRAPTFKEFFSLSNNVIYVSLGSLFQTIVYYVLIIYFDKKNYSEKQKNKTTVNALKEWLALRSNIRNKILGNSEATEAHVPTAFQITKDSDVYEEEARINDIIKVLNEQKIAKETGEPIPRLFNDLELEPPKELPYIMVHNLHHMYQSSSTELEPPIAVKGLSFGVNAGEVFGLLGPNGAGKSTTINLLSCDPDMSAPCIGDGYLGGYSVTVTPTKAFSNLGLIPQFDAIFSDVSVLDNLYVFARVKGLSVYERTRKINELCTKLELHSHKHKNVNELSGGNKRRLSVAIAFLGNPKIILMDEPSSGIDPAGRRKLLNMILGERHERAIVITTHSMEEAESLCTRVGIVVNGQLQCINSCITIKNRYGSGLRLEIVLDVDQRILYTHLESKKEELITWVKDNIHPDSVLTEEIINKFYFTIPVHSDQLGKLFDVLSKKGSEVNIKDYLISQPTLDQIFAMFAKRQMVTAGN